MLYEILYSILMLFVWIIIDYIFINQKQLIESVDKLEKLKEIEQQRDLTIDEIEQKTILKSKRMKSKRTMLKLPFKLFIVLPLFYTYIHPFSFRFLIIKLIVITLFYRLFFKTKIMRWIHGKR